MKIENENILEQEVKQEKKVKNKIFTPKVKTLTCFVLASALMVGSSVAYFSDYAQTTVEGTAGTVKLDVDNNINLLNVDGKDILNPGDKRNVSFTVNNVGNKSVDTEVIITLLSSVPMSDNGGGTAIDSLAVMSADISTYGMDDENKLNYGKVYSSEYELYLADDVIEVEGYGHYPRSGAKPVKARGMNYAMNKIVYVLDGTVLSGNGDFDEREIEWIKPFDKSKYLMSYLEDMDYNYRFTYDDFSDCNSELGTICLAMAAPFFNGEDPSLTVIIPPSAMAYSDSGMFETKERDAEYVYINYLVGDGASSICVPKTVKGFIYEDTIDGQTSFVVYTAEEVKDVYGIEVSYYDDFNMFYSPGTTISNLEYLNLSDDEKAGYTMCPDSKGYDFVLLFDPNSGNNFQSSNVSIEVEVRAKQHRNATAGWELVDTMLESVIQDSIFTVNYDSMHRVKLTGVKDGVDITTMSEITIPEGVQVIPASFFEGCTTIKAVKLPSTLEEIEYGAFKDCTGLEKITLPDGLESIGDCAFEGCTKLSEVVIPNSVISICYAAFRDCTSLADISIPDSVQDIGTYAFQGCTSLTELTIPESITKIPVGMFMNCTGLRTVDLPSTLTEIGDHVFQNCSSLESIELPNGLVGVGYGVFEDCTKLNNVVLPDTLTAFDYSLFEGCTSLTSVTLPSTLEAIPDTMFSGCTALTSVEIPESVTQIGYGSFEECTGLTSFVIPEGITYIDARAFYGCDNLTEITLPDSLNYISNKAFYCNKVVSTTIYTNNDVVDDYNWSGSLRNITVIPVE